LAAELRKVYRALQSNLVDVLTRKNACDAKVSRINGSAPADVKLRLREVELVARNLEGFTRDTPSITKELRLPDGEESNKLAWPRRKRLSGCWSRKVWPPPLTTRATIGGNSAMSVFASFRQNDA
jgi:hypothetical protein